MYIDVDINIIYRALGGGGLTVHGNTGNSIIAIRWYRHRLEMIHTTQGHHQYTGPAVGGTQSYLVHRCQSINSHHSDISEH